MKTGLYASTKQKSRRLLPQPRALALQTSAGSDRAAQESTGTLQARNRDLCAYAQTVAHDLKDPLAVIIATSDAIFHISDLTAEELYSYLQQIRSTARDMNDLIDSMLLFAEVSDAEITKAPLDMAATVARTRKRLEYLAWEHNAQISAPRAWPAALGHGPWVEEVWANLISNAIKHGGCPPHVELGATPQPDGTVSFWTRDDGPGLSPEARKRLFQPMSRIDTGRAAGHGLGLSIARRIVEKLGGQLGVNSEKGNGSLFYFTLPAAG